MAKKKSIKLGKIQKKKNLLIALEAAYGVVTTACLSVGVTRKTFYEYYNDDPEFAKACDEINNVAVDFVEGKLLNNIGDGDTTAMIFFLKCRGKKRGYVEKTEIDINANIPNIIIKPYDGEKDKK